MGLPLATQGAATTAVPTTDFLNSIGIDSTFPDRGQPIARTVEMVKYAGFRWVRGGIEGLTARGPTTVQTYLDLHQETGVRFSWGLVSGGTDLKKLIGTARQLAGADALLAFEGNNEPNNWGVTYQGEKGGGQAPSWLAVAKLQRHLYGAVKSDPVLKKYPVWSISENGAERDNVGLQFLPIPAGAGTLMPDGTKYADYAVCHNYIYHPNSAGVTDNKTWNAADPTSACKVDGLYGNYGLTWARHYRGYPEAELLTLPKVTTETGCQVGGAITEDIHALNLLSMYLDQFKRGWSYTSVYILRDRTDEGGNQRFGFYRPDYTPRKAALYLHNLTTILADRGTVREPGKLDYSIPEEPLFPEDIRERALDVWELEPEPCGEQTAGRDAAALDYQFGLGAQEDCPRFEHPLCCRQSEANAAQPPQYSHHVAVGYRVGRSQVDCAAHLVVGDQPFNSAAEVLAVNPGDELATAAHGSSQPQPHQAVKDFEDAALPWGEDHCGMAGICLIRLKQIRPRFLSAFFGISSENAAHRIAVQWESGGRTQEGVYVVRRDTSSRLNSAAGGRLFPGIHHHARFDVLEQDDRYSVIMDSDDGETHLVVEGQSATELPDSSIFPSLNAASEFFKRGSLGYSPASKPGTFDGLELRSVTWHVKPLGITRVESSFFENHDVFPPGSVEFDCALLMRDTAHDWLARESVCSECNEAHPALA